jgi:hypothetical protein
MALRLSIKYILLRIRKYYHSMMPLFRQERCTPWAPIWCHADFTSRERQHRLAQHDSLKPLNGTTRNACVPVRLYNIDLQIRANHSTNHSIAFPMNGPVECLKKLPCLDEKYHPQVTFLGPWDEWMKKAGKYKYLYEMDTDIAYNWLRVWVNANHPSF